ITIQLRSLGLLFYFFFSSRRRHTRSKRDWSSDVCSSDLPRPRDPGTTAVLVYILGSLGRGGATPLKLALAGVATGAALTSFINRSEERRVGKECRSCGRAQH